MQKDTLIAAYDRLSHGLRGDRYVSFSQGKEAVQISLRSLPQSIWAYLQLLVSPRQLIALVRLRRLAASYESRRRSHNDDFIKSEIAQRAAFFHDISGRSLDQQQIEAVIPDEDNMLVIAGAGSGKTLTIEAKVKYLTQCLGVPPSAILPISFTAKSAAAMKERINLPGINPVTFHSFGLSVLRSVERRSPRVHDGNTNEALLRSFLQELATDSNYRAQLIDFFLHYGKIAKSDFSFESMGHFIQYLKDQNMTTYKKVSVSYQGKTTQKNEVVKSIQERMIANFLLFHNVDYEYEKQYDFPVGRLDAKTRYLPDFTITAGDKTVYLEHFGIDENGNVPPFFAGAHETHEQASQKYRSAMEWKRNTHKRNGTCLIETYSYECSDDTFLETLASRLTAAGVLLRPMSQQEMWQTIEDAGKEELNAFMTLVATFLSLMKSNHYGIRELHHRNQRQNDDAFLRERTERFLLLFEQLYARYEQHLRQTEQIDFNDMISRAAEYISRNDYHCPLRYIIIDEFQDLSIGRYKILEAIRTQNPGVKFFCVGDDWQSIYRFAGSDMALFRDFEQYFGYTLRRKIETTYRFSQPLISLSSDFILKNPNQSTKRLRAPDNKPPTTLAIMESPSAQGDDTDIFVKALTDIIARDDYQPGDEIYLIGRYTFDLQRIKLMGSQLTVDARGHVIHYRIPDGAHKGQLVRVDFLTAHRSKGLEAKYVIVINCNSGKMGFPSQKADDPLLSILLSSADQFENGEERRLFYVAITRAKNHVVLLTDASRKSKFVQELQNETGERGARCPKCTEGDVVLRTGKGSRFYGCSNFAYGCDYTAKYA